MVALGIILARAGSKGLPDKCVRPLLGRPLIEHTFDHALASTRLTAVVLTTDSAQAQELARARKIEVIDRPPELATDTATVDAAARHAVETWEARHQRKVDVVALLYANIPVRAAGVIDRAVEHLERRGASSVRTVAPVGKHHPDWLHRLDDDRLIQFRPNSIHRRQDLKPLYYHDGAVLAVTRQALFDALRTPEDQHAFLGPDRRAVVQRSEDAVDVDEPLDLYLAEAVLRARAETNASAAHTHAGPVEATPVAIGPRRVGPDQPAYIVAEAGVNHDGSLEQALRLVDVAAAAGADAVKFQVFRANELATASAATAEYQQQRGAESQRAMLARLELSDDDFARVPEYCAHRQIEFLATPFAVPDVDRLLALQVRAIKVASTDLNNTPLLRRAAQTGLPLVVSTGAATAEEIQTGVGRLREWGVVGRLILLHCVSGYPAPLENANLRAIRALGEAFGMPCGFSDHTTSTQTGAWAVLSGACLLEKHFTLDRGAVGPDHAMSLDPAGLQEYVAAARAAERAAGTGRLGLSALETDVRNAARQSVVAACDLTTGTVLRPEMLTLKRPAGGIEPDQLDAVIGREAAVNVPQDTVLTWEMIR
jgi:sialic acid synthase SpsE/CMP-N-acetylneuraminic acid synthetase